VLGAGLDGDGTGAGVEVEHRVDAGGLRRSPPCQGGADRARVLADQPQVENRRLLTRHGWRATVVPAAGGAWYPAVARRS